MDRDEARTVKRQLAGYVGELLADRVQASAEQGPGGIGLGLTPLPDGGYGVAVRYRLGVPTARMVARKVAEQLGPTVDVRRTGRIRAVPGRTAPVPRPPVATALAVGETGRARPLRPGVSIAHVDVSAGTLGAFVEVDGALHALSNYHVLVGSPSARIGDPIVQPGPADRGRDPDDRVGVLAAFEALAAGRTARVDAAVARLDDPRVDVAYPGVGPITTIAEVDGGEEVAKIGRTTGLTQGRVTAIELDDVVVGYGEELGELRFDDQIEVESTSASPFSRGGDSGSLVYRTDGVGLGLLFAGSETGGDNGNGLTYLNPIGVVLESLEARLVG